MMIPCANRKGCPAFKDGRCVGEIAEGSSIDTLACFEIPIKPVKLVLKGNPKFYEILDQIKMLYAQKNAQYAITGDTERNFKDGAYLLKKFFKDIDNKELAYLISLVSKQYLGVIEIVAENKKGTIESLKDKFQDIAIYSIIAMILCEDEKEC